MHKARAFFFVSAGLLCLASAYHLGARSAHGQAGTTVDGAHIFAPGGPNGSVYVSGAAGRTLYVNGQSTAPAVPGTARIVATHADGGFCMAALENGDVYRRTGSQWTYDGNLVGSATASVTPSWGQVKAKYATPAPGKVTR
jgi:hypothetical protein